MLKKILWMSQHHPCPSQLTALKNLFGNFVQVVQDPNPFETADVIVQRFQMGEFDDLVVVAPLSVLDALCKRGIKPLYAECVEETDRSKIDFRGAYGKGFRFVRFQRVDSITINFTDP